MYILICDFIKIPSDVVPHVEPHSQWVKKYVARGIFVAAGPKKNQLGGAILVKSIDRQELMAMIAEDPYIIEAVAEYRIIDVNFKLTIDELEILKTV